MWIGVGGKQNSGKSYLYDILFKDSGFIEVELAKPMKKFFANFYQKDIDVFYNRECKENKAITFEINEDLYMALRKEFKSLGIRWTGEKALAPPIVYSPRRLLQYIGTEVLRKENDNIHTEWALSQYTSKDNLYIQALRFPNEIKKVVDNDGITIYLQRKEEITSDEHISENAVSSKDFHHTVMNNGKDKEQFKNQINKILQGVLND